MSRETTYKCDKCGIKMKPSEAVKLNIMVAVGNESPTKKPYDFCKECFLKVKGSFYGSFAWRDAKKQKETKECSQPEEIEQDASFGCAEEIASGTSKVTIEDVQNTKFFPTVFGPIGPSEKNEIFKLYIVDGLSAEEIAKKLGRLPKGVKRAITVAISSGEMEHMKMAFNANGEKAFRETASDCSVVETSKGSGVSNSGIMTKDSYVAPPLTKVMGGKRYDVGAIISLAKAGWTVRSIADELNYEEGSVRSICRQYSDSIIKK